MFAPIRAYSRPAALAWFWAPLVVLQVACSDPDPDPYQPLTEECDACLLESGAAGCGEQYRECEALPACDELVLCELAQQCYREPAHGSCASVRGCGEGVTEQELELSEAFETCARETCGQVCDFAPP
jgi:hypothetical protein